MTYPCPACGSPATLASGCPGCGRGPDPDAAEVIRLDGEIAALTAQLQAIRRRREMLATRVRLARVVAASPALVTVAPPPPPAAAPEASTRTVQNVLFILGGLLLGTAAIVFTAVAWAAYGVGGRALILAVVTALALGAPLLALRRRLVATAETFAAVGLLLVVLDGYAAWYVNLFGLASWPGARYAALVGVITVAVATGYAAVTGLAGPRFGAVAAAQLVPPLVAVDASLDAFGFALVFAALAAMDLVLVRRVAGPLRVVAWTAFGCALGASGLSALGSVLAGAGPAPALSGIPLIAAALALLAAAAMSGRPAGPDTAAAPAHPVTFAGIASATMVVTMAAASARAIHDLRPTNLLILTSAVALLLAALSPVIRASLKSLLQLEGRPDHGVLVVAGVLSAVAALMALIAGAASALSEPHPFDWQLPAAIPLLATALALALPTSARPIVAAAAAVAATLALPVNHRLHLIASLTTLLLITLALRVDQGAGRELPDRRGLGRYAVLLPLVGVVFVDAAGDLWEVLGRPYRFVGEVWTGVPEAAVGVSWTGALGVAGLAVAVALVRPLWGVPVGAVAAVVGVGAAGVPWPGVPAASLVLGLALVWRAGWPALVGVPLAAAGLAGALPTEGTTLAALGSVVLAGAVAGAVGRTAARRTAGWLAAVVSGVTFAVAAVLAGGEPLRTASFAVLAVAAAALALGGALGPREPAAGATDVTGATRRSVESRVLEAAALAIAVLALLLAAGHLGYAAAICTLWGVVAGLRALWRPARRHLFVAVAGGSELLAWWLLLAEREVVVTEAYTLPAAGAAVLAGFLALRSRPERSSWLAYGPGLAAALLPSLASVLVADGQAVRRLLLGAGAVVTVLAGAAWRRQAPVVLGGLTVVAVALQEMVRVWDLLPRWIFLAAGGFALIGLAMTYERRRRDLHRLRQTVGRMG